MSGHHDDHDRRRYDERDRGGDREWGHDWRRDDDRDRRRDDIWRRDDRRLRSSRSRSRERWKSDRCDRKRSPSRSRDRGGRRPGRREQGRSRERSREVRRERRSRSQSPLAQRDSKWRRNDGGFSELPAAKEGEVPPPPLPMDSDGGGVAADGGTGGIEAAAEPVEGAGTGQDGEEEDAGLALDAELTPGEIMMMQQMGIPFGFATSQGKKHGDAGAVKTKSTREGRQYMNRRGGFNRPLEVEATGQKVRIEWLRS